MPDLGSAKLNGIFCFIRVELPPLEIYINITEEWIMLPVSGKRGSRSEYKILQCFLFNHGSSNLDL
jgi:hypothetical protein